MIHSLSELADDKLSGRRVFIRVDFNVPLTPAKGVAAETFGPLASGLGPLGGGDSPGGPGLPLGF